MIPGHENDDDENSLFAREKAIARLWRMGAFGESVETSVLDGQLVSREKPTILTSMMGSGVPEEELSLLAIESVATRSKSTASTNAILRHVNGLLQFYLDTRIETSVTLTGVSSLVLIHD